MTITRDVIILGNLIFRISPSSLVYRFTWDSAGGKRIPVVCSWGSEGVAEFSECLGGCF